MEFRALAVASLVALVFSPPTVASADAPRRILKPVRENHLHRLAGNTKPMLALAQDEGQVSSAETLTSLALHLAMTPQQEEDLEQLLRLQQTRGASQFHRFLTPEEYGRRFGPDSADIEKITAWLEEQGFSNVQVAQSRLVISFEGTAAQAQTAFHTSIHRYRWKGETHYANTDDPQVPAALRGIVRSVHGLNDFGLRPRGIRQVHTRFTPGIPGSHFLAPGDFATIYDVQPLYGSGLDGSGIKIAVVGQSNVQISDIRAFRAAAGLPPKDPTVILAGTDPGLKDGDQTEADLDIEWAGAIARNAEVIFVTSTNVFKSILYVVDNNLAPILTTSYGLCEPDMSQAESDTQAAVFRQANAQGIAVIASSGDSGAAGCDSGSPARRGLAVDFPASLPNVTGIGGTKFNEGNGQDSTYWSQTNNVFGASALSYIPESAWNESSSSGLSASGGGASIYNAKPSWQTGVGVPNDGARNIPDVALAASPGHDGYLICSKGNCVNGFLDTNSSVTLAGGTSAGSPAFAGVLALLVQALGPQGNINPALYALAAKFPDGFHDVTTSDNFVACQTGTPNCSSGQLGYSAGAGYDQVTGLGSIDAYRLVNQWTSFTAQTLNNSQGPLRFVPITPCRVADTRNAPGAFGGPKLPAGSTREFDIQNSSCNVPATAAAYALNVTVVPDGVLSYLTSWPSGQARPFVSTLNSDGRIKANAAIVPAGKNGGVNVYVTESTHVILDISGYFIPAASTSGLQFFPLEPCRVADSRQVVGDLGGPYLAGEQVRSFPVQGSNCGVPITAQAYSLNLTAVPRSSLSFVTAWPSGRAQPLASILNAPNGTVTANAAIIPAGIGGGISTYGSSDTDFIIDINGYFAPAAAAGNDYYPVNPCRVIDTRNGNAQPAAGISTVNVAGGACQSSPAARAYALNATVVPAGPLAYLTLWPSGQTTVPYVSTLNADSNTVTSNAAIVPSSNGLINAYASGPTYLIVDLVGYFAP